MSEDRERQWEEWGEIQWEEWGGGGGENDIQ